MYHKCKWCKSRIDYQPIYYTQGFLKLEPGFEVYCDASCSLSAHEAGTKLHISLQNASSEQNNQQTK